LTNVPNLFKNIVPHSGIETYPLWGYSRTKGWFFGYKLCIYITSTTGPIVILLRAADNILLRM